MIANFMANMCVCDEEHTHRSGHHYLHVPHPKKTCSCKQWPRPHAVEAVNAANVTSGSTTEALPTPCDRDPRSGGGTSQERRYGANEGLERGMGGGGQGQTVDAVSLSYTVPASFLSSKKKCFDWPIRNLIPPS